MAVPTALYALLGTSTGAQKYVDSEGGSDSNGGTSISDAYATLQKARDNVATNGYVNLRARTTPYALTEVSSHGMNWQKNGASRSDPITIRTYPGDSPNYITGAGLAKIMGSFRAGASGSTRYSNLKIMNVELYSDPTRTRHDSGLGSATTAPEGFKVENFSAIEICYCRIHNILETAILLTGSVSAGLRVEDWHVHHCLIWRIGTSHAASGNNHDHGMYIGGETVGGAHAGQAFNNIIFDCHYGTCIQFYPYAGTNIAAYNTLYDTSEQNALDGVAQGNPVMFFWGVSPGMVDNIVSSNIMARARQDSSGSSTSQAIETGGNAGTGSLLKKNLPFDINNASLWGSSTMWGNNSTRVADNLAEVDPLWVDVVAGDMAHKNFNLQSNSPARDAGEAAYLPSDDFFGIARSGVKDIGAVAFAAGVDQPPAMVSGSRLQIYKRRT